MQRSIQWSVSQDCALCKSAHDGFQCAENVHAVCSVEHLRLHFSALFDASNTKHANVSCCWRWQTWWRKLRGYTWEQKPNFLNIVIFVKHDNFQLADCWCQFICCILIFMAPLRHPSRRFQSTFCASVSPWALKIDPPRPNTRICCMLLMTLRSDRLLIVIMLVQSASTTLCVVLTREMAVLYTQPQLVFVDMAVMDWRSDWSEVDVPDQTSW